MPYVEPPYPYPFRLLGELDAPQRRRWRDYNAARPLIERTHTAAYLASRLAQDAYQRKMLRALAMHDAPATLLLLWLDVGCTEEFPCY